MSSVLPARASRALVALLVVAAGVTAGALQVSSARLARADEGTISASSLRDDWDSGETGTALRPGTVKGGSFGELFSTNVSGQVFAQPLVVASTVIVATENDWVYGLNDLTGAIKWSTHLGTAWSAAEECTDLQPNVGVTGTPVYDPAVTGTTPHGAIYLVSEQDLPDVIDSNNHPVFEMNALDPTTGNELAGWPVQIKGAPVNDPTVPMNPYDQMQRPGLLLLGGSVYAAFGSHCDFQPYHGYVVGMAGANAGAPGAQTMWSDESGVTDIQAGIWQSGGGLMSDGPGRIFLASGDGISAPPGPGKNPPTELGDSVVRLGVLPDGSLTAKDFFSPTNAPYLDAIDGDFGSGGPVALPFGTTSLPDLMLQSGKVDGLFILNRDNLGGRDQGPGGKDAAVSETGKSLPGQWGHAGTFADTPVLTKGNAAGSHDYVYYMGTGQSNTGAPLRYFKAGLGGKNGVTPILTEVAQSKESLGYSSGSPVVTSDGTNPATGVVWVVDTGSKFGLTGTLQAFPLVPAGKCTAAKICTVSPIWTSAPFAGAGKFTTAATDSGHVYIASRGVTGAGAKCPTSADYCGQVLGFGAPSRAPLGNGTPVDFGPVAVGTPVTADPVNIQNTSSSPVMVDSVDASGSGFSVTGPFSVSHDGSTTPASFPVLLQPNDFLISDGVTFDPTGPGGASGSLQFSTDSSNFPVVGLSLMGTGTQNGFYSTASSVGFGSVPVNTSTQQQVTVTNGESVPVTWTTTASPGAPFSVSGLPSDGTTIQPGQAVPLTVKYAPTGTSGDNDTLAVTADDGTNQTPLSISLSGTGVADQTPTLTFSPPSVNFGDVPIGHNAQQDLTITNSGNLPAVVTVATPPKIPFGTPEQVNAGLPLSPGDQVQIPVSFSPASAGAAADDYTLTWTDALGTHQLNVPVTGTGAASAGVVVPPPGGGWTFNGSAAMTGTHLSLTRLAKNQAGSADYSVPVPSDGLKATFTVSLAGGTGANGMTFALLNAASEGQRAIGGDGPELGFGGLNGVAVTLDTSKDGAGYPSASFVGLATGASGGLLTFAKTANVAGLRTGTHKVGVSVSGGTVTVTVDGKQVLSTAVALPPNVRLAFTAATGAKDDNHVVTSASITSAGHRIPEPGGGWSYNGAAAMSGSDTRLTPAQANKAGSVIYPVPVTAVGLRAVFDLQISGGSGGDGMTFALLNPAMSAATTLGSPGVYLGLGGSAGVPGLGVVLGTDGPQSPAGFVAASMSTGKGGLLYQRKAQGIGVLTSGTHVVAVNVTRDSKLGVIVTVFLDQVQVLQLAEPKLTRTVRLAFTAGTGTTTDQHIVRSVAISASG